MEAEGVERAVHLELGVGVFLTGLPLHRPVLPPRRLSGPPLVGLLHTDDKPAPIRLHLPARTCMEASPRIHLQLCLCSC